MKITKQIIKNEDIEKKEVVTEESGGKSYDTFIIVLKSGKMITAVSATPCLNGTCLLVTSLA